MSTSTEKPKCVVLRAGGVFEMPVPDGRFGYGAFVIGGKCPYIIVHKSLYSARPSVDELVLDQIALVGWTMDALIYHRRWTVVLKDYPERSDVPYPNWKVRISGEIVTTDFAGKVILGPTTPSELDVLDFKTSRAPIAFQNALEALHGLSEWKPSYDEMTPTYAFKRMTRASS